MPLISLAKLRNKPLSHVSERQTFKHTEFPALHLTLILVQRVAFPESAFFSDRTENYMLLGI